MRKHVALIISRNQAEADAKLDDYPGARVIARDFEVFDMMRTAGVTDSVIPQPLENDGSRYLLLVSFSSNL